MIGPVTEGNDVRKHCGEAALLIGLLASSSSLRCEELDAFGSRVGVEQIGLYNERQVRGLSLQLAGNYRLDDMFFVRTGDLSDALLAGAVVRVGVNAVDYDFPTPTGVVEYKLRSGEAPGRSIEFGWREYSSPFVSLKGSHTPRDARADYGFQLSPRAEYSDGTTGEVYGGGYLYRYRLSETTTALGFVDAIKGDYDAAYVILPGAQPPKPLRSRKKIGPDWLRFEEVEWNVGFAVSRDAAEATTRLSIIRSAQHLDRADSLLLSEFKDDRAQATMLLGPGRVRRTDALEVVHSRILSFWPRSTATFRARAHNATDWLKPSSAISVGDIGLNASSSFPLERPDVAVGPARQETTQRRSAGVFVRFPIGKSVDSTAGVQHVMSQTSVSLAPAVGRSSSSQVAAHASVLVRLSERSSAFGTYTKDLEESGVAPASAVNRYEILPASTADQLEVGWRFSAGPESTLIASAFQIDKPGADFDEERVYRILSRTRHRGVEFSWSRSFGSGARILAGWAHVEPTIERPGVYDELRAVGVPRNTAMARLSFPLGAVVTDVQANYLDERYASGRGGVPVDDILSFSVGARWPYKAHGVEGDVRLRVLNATGQQGWIVGTGGSLSTFPSRAVQLAVTVNFENQD